MADLDLYQGAYSGPQIDSALAKVIGADATPTAGSQNMVTSGGVKSALPNPKTISLTFNSSGYCDKTYTEVGYESGFLFVPTQFIGSYMVFIVGRVLTGTSTVRFYIFTNGSCTAYDTSERTLTVTYFIFSP